MDGRLGCVALAPEHVADAAAAAAAAAARLRTRVPAVPAAWLDPAPHRRVLTRVSERYGVPAGVIAVHARV